MSFKAQLNFDFIGSIIFGSRKCLKETRFNMKLALRIEIVVKDTFADNQLNGCPDTACYPELEFYPKRMRENNFHIWLNVQLISFENCITCILWLYSQPVCKNCQKMKTFQKITYFLIE